MAVRPPFISRLVLKNYKSIASCDLRLGPLTFLVGPNGSGKSNCVDGVRFVADALRNSLDYALRERGGINEVRRRSAGRPTHFGMRAEFRLPDGSDGYYAFKIGARPKGGFVVQREECRAGAHHVCVENGDVVSKSVPVVPAAITDRLYLVAASGLPEFRQVFDAFSTMGFYNLNPDQIRRFQPPNPGDLLQGDGGNLASVLKRLATSSTSTKTRIEEYLGKVVPGISGVESQAVGPWETIQFRQEVSGSETPWRFQAANMSDGTLRALAVLVAAFQSANGTGSSVPLVAIEEPEMALHPAAAGVMLSALREAQRWTQLLLTSHSPDFLDDRTIDDASILAVSLEEGTTRIGPLDAAGRTALREHLYTAGELLRRNELTPDPSLFGPASYKQTRLFDNAEE
jgi:predicted ATPase